jgi:predicted nucleotide-binding protein
MQLGDSGIAILPDGGPMPGGNYPVYASVDVDDDGVVNGEVHFLSEPKYPRPIPIGTEFDLLMPHPDSVVGDNVYLRVRMVDEGGAVIGYQRGSLAQFRPKTSHAGGRMQKVEAKPLDARNVFVIHGRDQRLRDGMFTFLRSLALNPMEWAQAVELAGKGTPYVGEILDAAFANAQAVVVLFTPDDLARLRPDLCGNREPDHEAKLTPQARANVLFEAGMAMAKSPDRTILVEIGALRPFSDVGGRHTIRMDNSTQRRNDLASRLKKAGCPVNLDGSDWHTAGDLSPPVLQLPRDPESTGVTANMQRLDPADTTTHLMADLISELEDNLESARAPRVGDVYSRPSNRVWKDSRNKLNIPPDLHRRVADAYRQIDQWQDIVASGVSPNMGNMALELKVNDLRNDLPNLISELKKVYDFARLPIVSSDGQRLLLKASEDNAGSVMVVEMNEGLIVQVNQLQFAETGNRKSEARWREAVDELVRLRLITRPSPDCDILDVTHAGYEYADKLRHAVAGHFS